jgi:Flp pilus assembly protein TadD
MGNETALPPSPDEAVAADEADRGAAPSDGDRALTLLDERRNTRANPLRPQIQALLDQAQRSQADGRLDEAVAFVNDARRLDQNDPDVVCMLAELYREMGSLSQADSFQSECSSARADADQSSEPEIGEP